MSLAEKTSYLIHLTDVFLISFVIVGKNCFLYSLQYYDLINKSSNIYIRKWSNRFLLHFLLDIALKIVLFFSADIFNDTGIKIHVAEFPIYYSSPAYCWYVECTRSKIRAIEVGGQAYVVTAIFKGIYLKFNRISCLLFRSVTNLRWILPVILLLSEIPVVCPVEEFFERRYLLFVSEVVA